MVDAGDFVLWRDTFGVILQILSILIGLLLPAVQFWRPMQ